MSLTTCDRVARCEENCNHEGPCSFNEPLTRLINAYDQWCSDKSINEHYSLAYWIKSDIQAAKEFLA